MIGRLIKMIFKKKIELNEKYTTQDLTKAILKDHTIIAPVYTDKQMRRFIVHPRGTIFGSGGKRQKIIKF